MANPPSTSLLMILSLYTNLRRSGSSEIEAIERLRGLVRQLSHDDRQELLKGIDDWESSHGQPVNQVHAESKSDRRASVKDATAIRPPGQIVTCLSCGKKNDATKIACAYCCKLVQPTVVVSFSG